MPFDSSRPVVSVPTLAQATGFPARWLPTSISVHVVVAVLLFLIRFAPVTVDRPHSQRLPPEIVDLQPPPIEAPLLPSLESNSADSQAAPAPESSPSAPGRNAPSSASSKRLLFKGSQHIVSNTPDATNSVQTILQPDIEDAPRLSAPVHAPSMVKIASAQHQPSLAAPTLSAKVTAAAPPAPAPVPQPTLPKFQHVDVDTVPLTSATELADSPKIVAYKTSGHAFQPPQPPPPPAATKAAAPVVAKSANPAPPPPAPNVKPGGGTDSRNIVVVNAVETQSEIAQIPAAELHGSFEVDPNIPEGHSTGGSSTTAGVNGNGLASAGTGAGKGAETSASRSGAGTSATTGKGSGGNGKSNVASAGHSPGHAGGSGAGVGHGTGRGSGPGAGSGNGTGLSAGNGSSPFSGMTITGGTVSGATGPPASITVNTNPIPEHGAYGMTIVSNGSSGGGLRDYGVFNDGPVFTVYVDVSKIGIHGARWTLQYSASRDVRIAHAGYMLTAPFPHIQVLPLLPHAAVASSIGHLFVFQATLKQDGTLESFRVLETPDARLNEPMFACLTKWTFEPASMGNDKVPIKILMGIPIDSVMADTGVSQQAGEHLPADATLHAQ